MRIFLVDMENVHKLTNINKLTANDKLILFYSDNTPPMPMDTIKAIVDTNVSFELKRVHLGVKSALDFQLSSYLGYLIATYPEAKFIIISKDKGFDVVKKFWQTKKKPIIKLQSNIGVQEKNDAV
jgi:hypothetical protein